MGSQAENRTDRRGLLIKAAAFGGSLALGPALVACARPPEPQDGSSESPAAAASRDSNPEADLVPQGWKRFQSPNYPYEITIPGEFNHSVSYLGGGSDGLKTDHFKGKEIGRQTTRMSISPDETDFILGMGFKEDPSVRLVRVNNLDEYLKREIDPVKTISTEKIKISGVDAWMLRSRRTSVDGDYHATNVIFFYEGQAWRIDFYMHPSVSEKEHERFKKVLESFKFTGSYVKKDSSASSTQQKGESYVHPAYGYEVRYPAGLFEVNTRFPMTGADLVSKETFRTTSNLEFPVASIRVYTRQAPGGTLEQWIGQEKGIRRPSERRNFALLKEQQTTIAGQRAVEREFTEIDYSKILRDTGDYDGAFTRQTFILHGQKFWVLTEEIHNFPQHKNKYYSHLQSIRNTLNLPRK